MGFSLSFVLIEYLYDSEFVNISYHCFSCEKVVLLLCQEVVVI